METEYDEDYEDEEDDEQEPVYLKGEYWFDENGNTMYAGNDYSDMSHEMYVYQKCALEIADKIGLNYRGEYWPSKEDFEEFIIEKYSDDEEIEYKIDEDGIEEVLFSLKLLDDTPEERELLDLAFERGDARKFAINNWGWSRVHGNYIEVKTLNSETLKTIASGIENGLSEEGMYTQEDWDAAENATYYISTYTGRRFEIKLGEMKSPENIRNLEPVIGTTKSAAEEQLRDLDIKSMHPYYQKKGVIGDSFKQFFYTLFGS